MAILRAEEIREMNDEEIQNELEDLQSQLLTQMSIQAAGGAPDNPGRIGEMKKTIARIKTIQTEREMGEEEDIIE